MYIHAHQALSITVGVHFCMHCEDIKYGADKMSFLLTRHWDTTFEVLRFTIVDALM